MKLYPGPQSYSNANCTNQEKKMREFDTGATRDDDDDKFDYEGFLSPLVIRRYAAYLHKHRTQADGKKRDSDNWQKGIPISAYLKSLWRHLIDLWSVHRKYLICWPPTEAERTKEEALCAIIFNASGYLHEILKATPTAGADGDVRDFLPGGKYRSPQ